MKPEERNMQSVIGQSKGRNGSAVVVRVRVRRRRGGGEQQKSRWLFGREEKGWGPRAEFCLENRALGGLVQ